MSGKGFYILSFLPVCNLFQTVCFVFDLIKIIKNIILEKQSEIQSILHYQCYSSLEMVVGLRQSITP